MTPVRIQLKRTKGWRMPERAVYVGQPTKWANRWTVKSYAEAGFRVVDHLSVAKICTEAYRAWILGEPHWAHGIPLPPPPDLAPLRGRMLACWCGEAIPYERPHCHADVLLELANRPICEPA